MYILGDHLQVTQREIRSFVGHLIEGASISFPYCTTSTFQKHNYLAEAAL